MFWRQVENALRLAVRRSPLAPVLRDWLYPNPLQTAIIRGRRRSWDEAAAWLLSREGAAALDESRFHSAARGSINTDIELELLLTALRRTLLLQGERKLDRPAIIELLCSLVQQAINNEYGLAPPAGRTRCPGTAPPPDIRREFERHLALEVAGSGHPVFPSRRAVR